MAEGKEEDMIEQHVPPPVMEIASSPHRHAMQDSDHELSGLSEDEMKNTGARLKDPPPMHTEDSDSELDDVTLNIGDGMLKKGMKVVMKSQSTFMEQLSQQNEITAKKFEDAVVSGIQKLATLRFGSQAEKFYENTANLQETVKDEVLVGMRSALLGNKEISEEFMTQQQTQNAQREEENIHHFESVANDQSIALHQVSTSINRFEEGNNAIVGAVEHIGRQLLDKLNELIAVVDKCFHQMNHQINLVFDQMNQSINEMSHNVSQVSAVIQRNTDKISAELGKVDTTTLQQNEIVRDILESSTISFSDRMTNALDKLNTAIQKSVVDLINFIGKSYVDILEALGTVVQNMSSMVVNFTLAVGQVLSLVAAPMPRNVNRGFQRELMQSEITETLERREAATATKEALLAEKEAMLAARELEKEKESELMERRLREKIRNETLVQKQKKAHGKYQQSQVDDYTDSSDESESDTDSDGKSE